MNTRIGLLSVLVVIQLVLVAVALVAPLSKGDADGQLLGFSVESADRLVINDADNEVEIVLGDSIWQLADVPADAEKVRETLEKLAGLEAPWPVATSGSSAARFEVGTDNFQRRLRVFAGDEVLAELFLGTSPGFQRVHARAAGSDEIYSVALSNYELGVSSDVWVDKGVLASDMAPTAIAVEHLTAAEAGTRTLTHTDEGWLFNGVAADQDAAQAYANRFTTLRVLGVSASGEGSPAPTPLARLTISHADGDKVLVVSQTADEDEYHIAEQGRVGYRLAAYLAEQLLMTGADFLPADGRATEENS